MVLRQPYFSVIVPAHNEEKYIEKTLQSIAEQTYYDYETIVVTNGCTDKTEETVKKKANDKLRYLSLSRANVSVARNAGALNAKGKVLLFLDADTLLEKEGLAKIKEQFKKGVVVATTKVQSDLSKLKYKLVMGFKNLYNSTRIYEGCSGALICKKEDFQQVGGYDPEIIVKEHRKLILRLKEKGQYKCLDTYVTTSMRRFEQWGLRKVTTFWVKQWIKDNFEDLKDATYEIIR